GLAQPHPQYRILVVDDHPENRQLLIKLLEPIGFEVREASNGEEAIACWENWKPHLIWMDMRMPVVNGFEATRHIKAHAEPNSTVIIALTASALNEEIPKIKSAGCNDFIRKPFLECEIFDKIGQYLNLEYTYELLVPTVAESIEPLTTDALSVMSSDWLAALHEAAVQLDPEVMIELIKEIPNEYADLQKSLQSKVDNYDFDHILAVIQQVETRE
ncbi:MAG TPA: response regulator, partial [Stenomitos sp.]